MPSLITAARSHALDVFEEVYEPGQETWFSPSGLPLLLIALGNNDPANRVAIANFLLDEGADVAAVSIHDRYTALHILFGQNVHDFEAEAVLLKRLLDGGVDVNGVARGRWGTPLQTLASKLKFSDETLSPFYDVLFARHDLDLLRAGKAGRSSLLSARLLERQGLVARMEQYLLDHGLSADDS